jgi:hypothetical protein
MISNNGLAIIAIIVNLTAPILAVIVQSRINQPKQTPAVSHTDPIQSKGWLVRVFSSPWPLLLLICLNLLSLVYDLTRSEPLNRRTVLVVAMSVAGIVLNLGGLAYLSVLKMLARLSTSTLSLGDSLTSLANAFTQYTTSQSDIDSHIVDAIKALSGVAQPKPGPPPNE